MNLDDVIKEKRSSAASGMTLDTADSEELYSTYMATIQQEAERLALIPLPKVPKVKARSGSASFNGLPGGGRSYRKLLNKMKTRTKQVIKRIPGVMPCVRLYRNISGKSLMLLEQRLNEKQASISHTLFEKQESMLRLLNELSDKIDHMRADTESDDDDLTCDICGERHHRQEYQAEPTKISEQDQDGVNDDYIKGKPESRT